MTMRNLFSLRWPASPVFAAVFLLGTSCDDEALVRPNVLIISVDTLRADHVGCYGYERDTTPELDRFAATALRYERAYAPAPWTLPSHAGLLSGRHPHEMGIRDYESALPENVEMLAEQLSGAGYQCAGFTDSGAGGFVGADRGFARGFETYEHAPFHEDSFYQYDIVETVDRAEDWFAERDTERPFFLFLHTKSVHTTRADEHVLADSDAPYHKPPAYRTHFLPGDDLQFSWTDAKGHKGVHYLRDINKRIGDGTFDRSDFTPERLQELIDLYDGGVRYTDEQLGRLFGLLEERGLDENTLIIVTADHGEAFFEHELLLHKELYEDLLHVPLLVRLPKSAAKLGARSGVVRAPVSLLDIAPTVLQRLGVGLPDGLDGRVLPTVEAEALGGERPLFSAYQFQEDYFYRAAALCEGPWKLVSYWMTADGDPIVELFDLRTDPNERHPVQDQPERLADMLVRALAWYSAPVGYKGETLAMDEETLQELRALGYVR
ncbi:MAG: arylsulfatase A-like enzyme [Pseudohongiellaceae bacterium]|jgi:arylsulfatase A-like enzyme